MMSATDHAAPSIARRRAFSATAGVFAILAGTIGFGWIALVSGWFENDAGGIHRIHVIGGSGVGTGLFVATPFLILAWRRSDVAFLQMVAVGGLAYAAASVIATDWVSLAFAFSFALPVVLLLAIGRGWRVFARAGDGLAPATLVVSLAGAVFWVTYALEMARNQRIGSPNDPHVQMHHWTGMATMALGIVLLGLLASLRTRGWRFVALLVGLGSAVYGLASVVFATFPNSNVPYPGGEGAGWGSLAIAGGIAIVLASWWDARREPAAGGVDVREEL